MAAAAAAEEMEVEMDLEVWVAGEMEKEEKDHLILEPAVGVVGMVFLGVTAVQVSSLSPMSPLIFPATP
jgi:hypothetical protein